LPLIRIDLEPVMKRDIERIVDYWNKSGNLNSQELANKIIDYIKSLVEIPN